MDGGRALRADEVIRDAADALAGTGTPPVGCLGRCKDDETVFVLVARDKLAPDVVKVWATLAESAGVGDDKVAEAREVAAAMQSWQRRNGSKIPT